MFKLLIFTMMMSYFAFGFESYGTGKVVKVSKVEAQSFGGIDYFLVIRQGDQVGAMPILVNKEVTREKLQTLENNFVVFRGKMKSKTFAMGEQKLTVDAIDMVKLKKLTFDDINSGVAEINKKDPEFSLKYIPKQTKFVLSDSATQKAVLTSAALLLNDMGSNEGPQGKMRRDLTAGLILTSGIIMVADKIKNIVKVEKVDPWELPKNQEEKKLPLTSND